MSTGSPRRPRASQEADVSYVLLDRVQHVDVGADAAPETEVVVTCCVDGPLLLRGADVVRDEDGQDHPVTRPVVALCRCGKSARRPWCDGTHKILPKRTRSP